MTEQVDQKQRVLKLVVIGLGIAIAACVVIIIVGIGLNVARTAKDKPADVAAAPAAPAPAELGALDIPIPAGYRPVEVTGGMDEIRVLLDGPGGRQLLLIDRASGRVRGTLRFVPGETPAP